MIRGYTQFSLPHFGAKAPCNQAVFRTLPMVVPLDVEFNNLDGLSLSSGGVASCQFGADGILLFLYNFIGFPFCKLNISRAFRGQAVVEPTSATVA